MAKEVKWELTTPTSLAVYKDIDSDYMKQVREHIYKYKVHKGEKMPKNAKVWLMPAGKSSEPQKILTQIGAMDILDQMELNDLYDLKSAQGNNVIFECRLFNKEGELVAQSFGSGSGVGREYHFETIKAQKRAMVQAVLRLTGLKRKGWSSDMEPEIAEIIQGMNQLDDKKVQHLIDIYNAVKKEKGEMDKETGEFSNSDFNKVHSEFMTFKRANNVVKNSISEIAKTLTDKDYQYLIELFSKKEYGDIIDGQMETLFQAYLVRDKA